MPAVIDFALRRRLREAQAIADLTGRVGGKPAIDLDERKSNDRSAFSSIVITLIAPGRNYDQGGVSSTRQALFRFEIFSLSADPGILLKEALATELQTKPVAAIDGVRFAAGYVFGDRPGGVDNIGELRVYRRILDMDITATI